MPIYRKIKFDDIITIKSIVSTLRVNIKPAPPIPDIHDFWEIALVERGTYHVLLDGVLRVVGCGECILYPPLVLHNAAMPQDLTLRIMSFECDSPELYKIASRPMKLTPTARDRFIEANELGLKNFYYPADGLKGMLTAANANLYDILKMKKNLEFVLLDIVKLTEKGNSDGTTNYKKELYAALDDYLRMNISDTLSLEDIAAALSVSISQLKLISNEAFGMPPISYFIHLKIEAAKKLIRESALNFSEISERLGFGTVHYFSNLFKKRTGMTPSEYRKTVAD
jgi:AraC-like DNA-binding protein